MVSGLLGLPLWTGWNLTVSVLVLGCLHEKWGEWERGNPMRQSAFVLVKTLTKVEIYFSLRYPSGHKMDPGSFYLAALSSPWHCLYPRCLSTTISEFQLAGGASRRCPHRFCSHPVAAEEARKWSHHSYPRCKIAKLPPQEVWLLHTS